MLEKGAVYGEGQEPGAAGEDDSHAARQQERKPIELEFEATQYSEHTQQAKLDAKQYHGCRQCIRTKLGFRL